MSVFELQKGVDYDLVASNIQCRADRSGAEIFEVQVEAKPAKTVRVLAHSETDAQMAAEDE